MRVAILSTFVVLLFAVPALGGTAQNPEITDPANDQAGYNPSNPGCNPNAGPTAYNKDDFKDIDIRKVWVEAEYASTDIKMFIETEENVGEGDYYINFKYSSGPSTMPGSGSTAGGENLQVRNNKGAYSGVAGGSSTSSGKVVSFTFPKDSINAVGGEIISNMVGHARRPTMDIVPALCGDNWGFRDSTSAGMLQLARPDPVPGVALNVSSVFVNGALREVGNVTLLDGNAVLVFGLNVTNIGDAQDNITLDVANRELQESYGANFTFEHNYIHLNAGAFQVVNLTINLTNMPAGAHGAIVAATSTVDDSLTAQALAAFTIPGDDPIDTLGDDDNIDSNGAASGGNNTGNTTAGSPDDKGAPGVGVALLIGSMGLIALARRRQ